MRRVQTRARRQVPARGTRKPLPRKVHVNGKEWTFRVTRSRVLVRDPATGATTKIDHSQFTGISWDNLERLEWKQRGYRITPQDVKDFIENGLKPVKYESAQDYRFMVSRFERPKKAQVSPK